MAKILLSIPKGLLEMVDSAAKENHQNRSEFVRAALVKAARDFEFNKARYKRPAVVAETEAPEAEEE